jgi:hypothetical protein
MHDQNAVGWPVTKRNQVINGNAGDPIEIDLETDAIDEIHIFCIVAVRWTWHEKGDVPGAKLRMAVDTTCCSTFSGGELVRHCRYARENDLSFYIVADAVAASTINYELGQYRGQ